MNLKHSAMDRIAAVWVMLQGNPPQAENLVSEILFMIGRLLKYGSVKIRKLL